MPLFKFKGWWPFLQLKSRRSSAQMSVTRRDCQSTDCECDNCFSVRSNGPADDVPAIQSADEGKNLNVEQPAEEVVQETDCEAHDSAGDELSQKQEAKKEPTDEDPKSLTVLCDDIIREILSFMSVRQRVRLSRTSKIIHFVVNESLLSVHHFDPHYRFSWSFESGPKTESRLKTLSRMTNLRTMSFILKSDTENWQKVIEVLVNNCQYVEHIKFWDMECVDAYVSGLHGKGVPVRLKTMQFSASNKQSHHLPSILQKSSAKLIFDARDFDPTLLSIPGVESRIQEITGMHFSHEIENFLLSGIRKLTDISIDDSRQLQKILQSMPHLNHIGFRTFRDDRKMLNMLSDAKQEFIGIEYQTHGVEHKYVRRLLEKKGQKLRRLKLRLVYDRKDPDFDIIDLLRRCCPRVKDVHIYRPNIEQYFYYSEGELTIRRAMVEDSLLPLLNLFPKMRSISFGGGMLHVSRHRVPEVRMQELRDFANRNKKHCLRMFCTIDGYENRFDGNLRY